MSWYQKGKTNLDFTEATDSEWQWHQLGHMQACTSLQTGNHASNPQLSFLQAGCPSCRPANSVKALKVLHRPYTWYGQKCGEPHAGVWFQRLRYAYACGHTVRRTLITDAGQKLETNDIGSCANRNVRRILVRGSMPLCHLRREYLENLTTKWCILKYI